ncbi:MAG: mRNA cap guanine-N7 methyltransferase [Bogoriella megaspora]|nr:MAG: mRNA cap guanine-N7 methyltransferase [Bogoriella megaspora]
MADRRGSVMFDPARDHFVSTDDAGEAQNNAEASQKEDSQVSPTIANGKKRRRPSDDDFQARDSDAPPTQQRSPPSQTITEEPATKKPRTTQDTSATSSPAPIDTKALPKIPRKQRPATSTTQSHPKARKPHPSKRRAERLAEARLRTSPPKTRDPSLPRDPSPPREPSPGGSRSPPRQRKRPGAAARVAKEDINRVRRLQEERERQQNNQTSASLAARGVHDVVRQHYNAVPERGREWRRTDSKIKGLRSFNNWVKSAVIQKFAPNEDFTPGGTGTGDRRGGGGDRGPGLLVLDIGCGKGGDLGKWQQAPQRVDLYVGLDPADVSIENARERFKQMKRRGFDGRFFTKDCFGEALMDIAIVREVGFDENVGPGANPMAARFGGGGGFDVVSMMFCMHYAFESEAKARQMLRNVAGALKKGGRFLGVIPNSDVLTTKVEEHHGLSPKANGTNGNDGGDTPRPDFGDSDDGWDPEKSLDAPEPAAVEAKKEEEQEEDGEVKEDGFEWGNNIYRVKFPGKTPKDGIFRPPFGWKYFYFLEEAVEEVPEYVVPWEAFRALAEDYNLELQYRKPFPEVWEEENDHPALRQLSVRMGVRGPDEGSERFPGPLLVSKEELDAAGFYHAFCFYKV